MSKTQPESFTFSFWFRRTSFENDPHGIVSLGNVVLINYNANVLTFNVEEFNCTNVGSIRVPNLYSKTDGLDWLHITVSVNVNKQIFQVVIFNSKSGSNRYVTAPITVKSLGNLQKLDIRWSLDTAHCPENAWSFEISTFIFLPNWYPTDTTLISLYRIKVPSNCESKCKTACLKNGLCPPKDRFISQINVPNVILPKELCSVPLYRNLSTYFGNSTLSAPSFHTYLIGFEFNIPSFQSSTYKTNKNILINLNNDVADCDNDLTYVLPDNVIRYGIVTVESRGNALRFYLGGSKANTYAAYYDFVFESNNYKGITKVNVELLVNSIEKTGKLVVYIDDLRASYEITTIYPPQPITRDTVIYSHPSITGVRINVHNPRFNFDFYYNIFSKTYGSTYPSLLCRSRSHCEKCAIIPKATSLFCERCAKGYKMINNMCLDESSFLKK